MLGFGKKKKTTKHELIDKPSGYLGKALERINSATEITSIGCINGISKIKKIHGWKFSFNDETIPFTEKELSTFLGTFNEIYHRLYDKKVKEKMSSL